MENLVRRSLRKTIDLVLEKVVTIFFAWLNQLRWESHTVMKHLFTGTSILVSSAWIVFAEMDISHLRLKYRGRPL